METYKVDIADSKGASVGSVRVTVVDRAAAPAAAIAQYVTAMAAWNAKYERSFVENGVQWIARNDNAADFTATKVRKAQAAA